MQKMRFTRVAMVIAACSLIGACATSSRFEWGHYEGALYVYAKKPDKRDVYRKALVDAIAKGRREGKVAPGLLAELGYLDLEGGDSADAIPLFREEMRRFPESREFLTKVIQRAQAPSGAQGKNEVAQ